MSRGAVLLALSLMVISFSPRLVFSQPSISRFQLVLPNGDVVDDDFRSGDALSLDSTPEVNIIAVVSGSCERVDFSLNSIPVYHRDTSAPYALEGDFAGELAAWRPKPTAYNLTATPYASAGGTQPGVPLSIAFTPTRLSPPVFAATDAPNYAASAGGTVQGELRVWHKVTLGFRGPTLSELSVPNPFTHYRLDVTFTHVGTGDVRVVPGYFAADGRAANTHASSGNVWLVHFAPAHQGDYVWSASFTTGPNVAQNGGGASAGYMDGATGRILGVAATDKSVPDNRARGRLEYTGERYLRWAETGEFFLKQGNDSPENLLAYKDFDGLFARDNIEDGLLKDWSAHVQDWDDQSPTFAAGKGKGLIGAINYIAEEGLNAFSFLTMNIQGDDKNVFPYTTYTERFRFDVSRLAQWEVVLEHGDHKGMFLHFKTQETENEKLLDGGDTGVERKLYYRELIARFSHHLALNWNLGEENGCFNVCPNDPNAQTDAQRVAMAAFFAQHDPYRHHISLHSYPHRKDEVYGPLADPNGQFYVNAYTGLSMQTDSRVFAEVHDEVVHWVQQGADAYNGGWAVAVDEPGDPQYALCADTGSCGGTPLDVHHKNARTKAMWGTFLGGGWGNEWYYGYSTACTDLSCQDWRSRASYYPYTVVARQFFAQFRFPLPSMISGDAKVSVPQGTAYLLYQPDVVYVGHIDNGGVPTLDMSDSAPGNFGVVWYDAKDGGRLTLGASSVVGGVSGVALGTPPGSGEEWAFIVARRDWLADNYVGRDGEFLESSATRVRGPIEPLLVW